MVNDVKLPKKFIELSKLASKAAHGFYVLGNLDGLNSFYESLSGQLHSRGWTITTGGEEEPKDDMRHFMEATFLYNFHPGIFPHARIKSILRDWLSEHSEPETAAFATDPKNFGTLEESIKAAIEETKQKFGDPLTIQYGQRSFLRAAFDTVASRFSTETPETRLTKVFQEMAGYQVLWSRTFDVHPSDFRDRVSKALAAKGWDMKGSGLRDQFVWLESAARSGRQIPIRKELQDDTIPGQKPWSEARKFMLAHTDDLSAAITETAQAFLQEQADALNARIENIPVAGEKPAAPKSRNRKP